MKLRKCRANVASLLHHPYTSFQNGYGDLLLFLCPKNVPAPEFCPNYYTTSIQTRELRVQMPTSFFLLKHFTTSTASWPRVIHVALHLK